LQSQEAEGGISYSPGCLTCVSYLVTGRGRSPDWQLSM